MENKMNVFAKLQRARVMLQDSNLKKSGENKFSKYKYFELKDFLPKINEIMDKLGLFSFVEIDDKLGRLMIINTEDTDDRIIFTIPGAEMDMKGANAIQQVGAIQTYVRRYLYVNAFEIAENDQIDATPVDKVKPTKSTKGNDDLETVKAEVVEKCKKLSGEGKRTEVNKIITKYNKTPNPATIKSVDDLKTILEELKTLE